MRARLVAMVLMAALLPSSGISAEVHCLQRFLHDRSAANPETKNVFIQQEHEGHLDGKSRRNFFKYYRPVGELKQELVKAVVKEMRGWEQASFFFKKKLKPDAWQAFSSEQKVNYVKRLEISGRAETGLSKVWEGDTFLLLEKSQHAPEFIAHHPNFEKTLYLTQAQHGKGSDQGYFRFPEITTRKDRPAFSIAESLDRARQVAGDTGHAFNHFHVFLRANPERLLIESDRIVSFLERINERTFLEAIVGDPKNLKVTALQPWHQGRSARVRKLLIERAPTAFEDGLEDGNSSKFVGVAFRYWGIENEKMVVSLRLRGAVAPVETDGTIHLEQTERYLNVLKAEAEQLTTSKSHDLAKGPAQAGPLDLDYDRASQLIEKFAEQHKIKSAQYLGLNGFFRLLDSTVAASKSRYLDENGRIQLGFLAPFGDFLRQGVPPAETVEFLSRYLSLALQANSKDLGSARIQSLGDHLENAYQSWAAAKLKSLGPLEK